MRPDWLVAVSGQVEREALVGPWETVHLDKPVDKHADSHVWEYTTLSMVSCYTSLLSSRYGMENKVVLVGAQALRDAIKHKSCTDVGGT